MAGRPGPSSTKPSRSFLTAQAQVDSAQAQVRIAQEQLSYTVLFADAPGAVTAIGAEPGEVVHAGQMIVQLARQGGRDAVFDVPEQLIRTGPRDPLVQIALTNDPTVRATGRVREVAPQADPTTRTWQVKVGIIDPPQGMRVGVHCHRPHQAVRTSRRGGSAERADRGKRTPGRVGRRSAEPDRVAAQTWMSRGTIRPTVVISQGLETGEVVVTAGVQMLRPGQKVRLLGAAS